MPLLVLSGKHVFLSIFGAIGKKAASHRTPRRQVPRREDESDVVHHCVLTANDLFFFFWRRRLSSYHSQLLLSGRRKPLNATHGTTTTLQQFKFLSFSSVLGRSRASRRALPIELVGKTCLTPPGFLLRSQRRSTPCYDLYLWAQLLPRLPPVEVVDSAQTSMGCLGDVGPVGTCLAS